METVYFKGNECHTCGNLPSVGSTAPDFSLVTPELKEVGLSDFPGKKIVLNIFPSLDTPVCATSVRRFNEKAAGKKDAVVLCVSVDLPFAAGRFCTLEGLKDVIPASAFRSSEFARSYGVELVDGPLKGLLTRAVVIIDADRKVIYRELVDEITGEPDYDAALGML
ncbi:thiol peroxidase [Muribaculum intestinale]|jgi:thiol peroxidase|uniref:Thiol peroxidase n=1 Tax=Muribaculum intestinale TaxID=1796646 RepID=A0A1B1SBG1_9BACT|nr:thiol peroxidase [Muribaculum intestinale]ANU64108.1 lipid hydroperoxide peroxidase [Muribaculum intestinale]ASB37797.1 lipid hydroperoxide peroxidase [Muribaculum intestinale]MYM11448.1 thiol peroxidase [Muribaculum intestinale]PWB05669.1 thiol peroxidase [Muribaculum intestinale]PWB12259.1 thiol peroxidase [Muribaculum intestinale]